jgi:hypothetical protein
VSLPSSLPRRASRSFSPASLAANIVYPFTLDEAVYMSFIDWMAAMAKKKGRQKSHQTYQNCWKWLSE